MDYVNEHRKSFMLEGEIYFWTATINKWMRLLNNDLYKDVIVRSLNHLSNTGKLDVFAFVIMPNHIHLIWRINESNGKETTQASFMKHTAHEFKKMLMKENDHALLPYAVDAGNKRYEFWQRDPLAIHLYTKQVAYQKLDYIHGNPVQDHWQLVKDFCDYKYSSTSFYELDQKHFSFLNDLRNEF